ncbi:MAG: ribonuclease HII [Thermodesulfobacteriota bacterium]|nr:ribonuclease HII [Thermodesulfobacteriota bacterium]
MTRDRCASFSFVSRPDPAGDTFYYERTLADQGFTAVAGVDEAGRGPLAGPVVAGCVILVPDSDYLPFKDSKKLTAARRDELFGLLIHSDAAIGVGVASAEEIDQINILQASLLAMKRAVHECAARLSSKLDFLLVDGTFTVPMDLPQQALVKGESKSASIAAASIIAKVSRDRLMAEYHEQYPQYNLLQHKGYPTRAHRQVIADYGPSPIHRKTFKGVREYCPGFSSEKEIKQSSLW